MKKKILVIPSDKNTTGYNRSIDPHMQLENKYPEEFFVDIDFNPDLSDEEYLKQYDIVHYHKKLGSYAETKGNEEFLLSLGIVPVMDISEYWIPDEKSSYYQMVKENNLNKMLVENIKNAHFVTCSNYALIKEIKKIRTGEVVYMPTGVDTTDDNFKRPKRSDRIRIGLLPSSDEKHNVEVLDGMVAKIKSDGLLDKVQFVLCGFDLDEQTAYFNAKTGQMETRPIHPMESDWYKYEKILSNDYKAVSEKYKKHLTTFEKSDYKGKFSDEAYRRIWKKPRHKETEYFKYFDVLLMPMRESMYNKCADPFQLYRASCASKAVIAQNIGNLKDQLSNIIEKGGVINLDNDAVLVDTSKNHKDWYRGIKKIIPTPKAVKHIGKNLKSRFLPEYSYDNLSDTRKNLYNKLVDKLEK